MANEEIGNESQDSGDEYFDIGNVTDSDEQGDEMAAAEKQTAKVLINLQHRASVDDLDLAEVYAESSLVKRAKKLVKLGPAALRYVHYQKPKANDPMDIGPRVKPDSLMNRFAVYDALFDNGSGRVAYPHLDTFKGRLVDHEGEVFSKINLRTRELVEALNAAGMENPGSKEITESLHAWALDHKRDSLRDYFEKTCPEWDGVSRLETELIKLFQPHDTPLTRLIGRYFWLSLYNRITRPGSMSPIAIALIGGQDAGKSWFSLQISRILSGDPEASVVTLDLAAKNYNKFLQTITGRSIIANVGEMSGFRKGDMLRIKEFVTRTEDDLDFKFGDAFTKARQWVIIMDGNGYEGLQRDDTGNRRFYPLFVFQDDDKNGQPQWKKGEKVDFSNFKEDLWQIMGECKAWMAEHGPYAYNALVAECTKQVAEFSAMELDSARGVMKDDLIEINLKYVLVGADWRKINGAHPGFFLPTVYINEGFIKIARQAPFSRSLAPHMKAMNCESKQMAVRGYFIHQDRLGPGSCEGSTVKDLKRYLYKHGMEDEVSMADVDAEIKIIEAQFSSGGGF